MSWVDVVLIAALLALWLVLFAATRRQPEPTTWDCPDFADNGDAWEDS